MNLIEGRPAQVDLFMIAAEGESHQGLVGLHPADVDCLIKRCGRTEWKRKDLTPASWQDVGHGIYALTLDAHDFEGTDMLTLLVQGHPGFSPPIRPVVRRLDVVEARQPGLPIPQTVLCGRVLSLDQKGKAKAAIIARVAQLPLTIGGAAICNDPITTETNEEGYFELSVVTGAIINVQIPALNYQKQFAVPPPPAAGVPVRLFSV
jgi:hypothetical protein